MYLAMFPRSSVLRNLICLWCIIILLLSCTTTEQKEIKQSIEKLDDEGHYYLTLLPEKPKGLLLIPCGFNTPEQILQETELPIKACEDGYVVVIPFLHAANVPDTASLFQSRLSALIPQVMTKYKIPQGRFIIGGLSWAGHQSIYYAEKAFQPDEQQLIRPNLVFAVDPPLDMERLHNEYQRIVGTDTIFKTAPEAEMIVDLLQATFGGSPEENRGAYQTGSSYTRNLRNGGNAQYLRTVPVRLYSDPDIDWYLRKTNTAIEWTNTADATAFVNELRLLGNNQAEYVSCLGKGRSADGQRHPHSFSMLDVGEFLQWARGRLEKKE
jgi:hypothetical protein